MDKIENVELHIKMDENEKNSENEKIIELEKIRKNWEFDKMVWNDLKWTKNQNDLKTPKMDKNDEIE